MLAQNFDAISSQAELNKPGRLTLGDFISDILPYVFGAAGIALLFYLVMGGFQLMTSRGDPKAMQGAQAKITNALIGFVIIAVSAIAVRLIGQVLGIDIFVNLFGSRGTGGR